MMKQRGSITLFRYWNRLRAGRSAPRRSEIEPADIKSLLADTFILEQDARGEAVFRLAGTRLCATYDRELKGASFASLWRQTDHRLISRLAHGVFHHNAPVVMRLAATSVTQRPARFELLVLPLASENAGRRAIGVLSSVNTPFWLGADPIVDTMLEHVDLIDPDNGTIEAQLDLAEQRAEIAAPSLAPSAAALQPVDPLDGAVRIGHLLVLEGGRGDINGRRL
ncbi:PAS domain-containing protein [Oryzicola mucosus]